mmetsp:Transcript_30034/g.96402  ORF Transcript_30034/g.96402 Transcript_30034/m.96402 type:complete len:148 (-) Transcript_30034:3772-4215(-)
MPGDVDARVNPSLPSLVSLLSGIRDRLCLPSASICSQLQELDEEVSPRRFLALEDRRRPLGNLPLSLQRSRLSHWFLTCTKHGTGASSSWVKELRIWSSLMMSLSNCSRIPSVTLARSCACWLASLVEGREPAALFPRVPVAVLAGL